MIEPPEPLETRILVCTPHGKDAKLACAALEQAGLECFPCTTLVQLVQELHRGAGAILTVEEILPKAAATLLIDFLSTQPTWSDLPVLVLTKPGGESPWTRGAYEWLGNLTLLERPVRVPSLISVARSALRARQRQYEIRQADQRKDEFLAMLGHELRNPLAPISAAATLLELMPGDIDRVKRSSNIIARQVGHMTNLIDDLLDVARVTRGLITLDRQPLDLRDILSEAVEQVRPLVNTRHHELALHLPAESALVMGDRKRMVQVVVNILNNASKYTPEGGHIDARLQLKKDAVMLDISDNGIGMTPELIPHVFDLFSQAKRASDRSQGGLGLGLALVKSLIESHGGKVYATSKGIGQGSTFTLRLSRLMPELNKPHPAAVEPAQEEARSALRIMVVDDNRDAANTLEMFLGIVGHQVAVEYDAKGALARAEEVAPQVWLVDIGLPDMDGLELARRLRAMPATTSSKLIAVTGYSQEQDKKKSFEAGFDYHLVKPINTEQLLALLQEISASS